MLGLSVGLTEEEVIGITDAANCAAFDDTDRAVLRYAEALALENHIEDALYATLESHFSQRELIELCVSAAMAGMINRVHATFHTDVDETTREFLAGRDLHQGDN